MHIFTAMHSFRFNENHVTVACGFCRNVRAARTIGAAIHTVWLLGTCGIFMVLNSTWNMRIMVPFTALSLKMCIVVLLSAVNICILAMALFCRSNAATHVH